MLVLAFICLVSVASASAGCCQPKQWEGVLGMTMATTDQNKTSHYIEGTMLTSVDADRKMEVYRQTLQYDGQPVEQTALFDFNAKRIYIVQKDGSCQAFQNDAPIFSCIPDNATKGGMVNFGFGDNLVKVDTYEIDYKNFKYYVTVTTDQCVPVISASTGGDESYSQIQSITYTSIKAGIADPSIFNIPSACTSAPLLGPIPGLGKRSLFR